MLLAALSWRVSLRGLSVVERAWTGTSRLARWSGVEATESVTPLEHAARIDEALGTDKVAERLAESYGAVRFGRRTLESEAAEEIEVGWREIRSRLLRRLLLPGGRAAQVAQGPDDALLGGGRCHGVTEQLC